MRVTELKDLPARLAPWAVTAALALAALWLTSRVIALRSENESLRTERMIAEVAYKLGQTQLAERTLLAENMINRLGTSLQHAKSLTRLKVIPQAAPAGFSEEARATVVWDPEEQTGLISGENFPAIAETQDYQVWIIDSALPDPVSAGTFRPAGGGKVLRPFKPDHPVTAASGSWSAWRGEAAGRSRPDRFCSAANSRDPGITGGSSPGRPRPPGKQILLDPAPGLPRVGRV